MHEAGHRSTDVAHSWEGYRKRARKLEGELDVKLASFTNLCSKYDGPTGASPLVEETLDAKANELERLLQELESVNASMQSVIPESDAHAHTLSRHRDILNEYVQECAKLKSAVSRTRHRSEALEIGSEATPLIGMQGSTGTLLRERATLHNASAGIDEIIHHATAIADDIKTQGTVFQRMSNRLMEVTQKYPVVHGLLRSISRRKSRDAIILTVVVASCLALIIVYLLWR